MAYEIHNDVRFAPLERIELGKLADEVYGADNATSIAFTQAAEAIGRLRYELQLQAAEDCPGRRADDLYRS